MRYSGSLNRWTQITMHLLATVFQVALIVLVSGVGLSHWGKFLLNQGDIPNGWATLIGSTLGAVAAVGASIWAALHQVKSQVKAADQARQEELQLVAQSIILDLETVSRAISRYTKNFGPGLGFSIAFMPYSIKIDVVDTPLCEKHIGSIPLINTKLADQLQHALSLYKELCGESEDMGIISKDRNQIVSQALRVQKNIRTLIYKFQGYIETGSTSMEDLNHFAKEKIANQKMVQESKAG
jgi:hypothetical protein